MTAITPNCWSESDQKAIREQLVRILNSGPFHQSQRRQRFLEYIVNETLAGRGERLKGYNIALEVFDRPETFDPTVDTLVRMEAARLRDRLREYYEGEGQNDPVRIDLPKGAYSPHIEFRQGEQQVTIFRSRSASTACPSIPGQFRSARPFQNRLDAPGDVGRRSSADHRGRFLGIAALELGSVAAR